MTYLYFTEYSEKKYETVIILNQKKLANIGN